MNMCFDWIFEISQILLSIIAGALLTKKIQDVYKKNNINFKNKLYQSAAKTGVNSLPKHSLFLIVLGYLILLAYMGAFSYLKTSSIIKEAEKVIDKTEISSEINIGSVKPKSIDLEESIKRVKHTSQVGLLILIITGIVFVWTFNRHVMIHSINEKFKHDLKLIGHKLTDKQIRELEYKWATMKSFEDYEKLMSEINGNQQ